MLKFGQISLPNPSEGGAFTFEIENDLGYTKTKNLYLLDRGFLKSLSPSGRLGGDLLFLHHFYRLSNTFYRNFYEIITRC